MTTPRPRRTCSHCRTLDAARLQLRTDVDALKAADQRTAALAPSSPDRPWPGHAPVPLPQEG
ncbi:hypothetical protein AB0E08_10905 [Streptomyces sp. NPDC048281]|uniref:hypothetical protein n=1 Tax=Streptomyces sp. NPDC048281 TaxID=3154715 RepID=UPI0034180B21